MFVLGFLRLFLGFTTRKERDKKKTKDKEANNAGYLLHNQRAFRLVHLSNH
jgi:hypothetical protein